VKNLSSEHCEPLINPRKYRIGEKAKNCTENSPSDQQIGQEAFHVVPKLPGGRIFGVQRIPSNFRDMVLYPKEQDPKRKKDPGDNHMNADVPIALRCPVGDKKTGRYQRTGRETKGDRTEEDGSKQG
jgi:hypothetical protein